MTSDRIVSATSDIVALGVMGHVANRSMKMCRAPRKRAIKKKKRR